MLDKLIENGYWLTYVGAIIEGETALLLGALASQQGLLNLGWVIVAAFAGATTGDQVSYQVCRVFGPRMIASNATLARRTARARRMLAGHPVKFILLSRFLWGLRTASMLALASAGVPTRVFAPANLVACAIWAVVIGGLGYAFSHSVTRIVAAMHEAGGRAPAILLGIAAFIGVLWAMRALARRYWRSAGPLE